MESNPFIDIAATSSGEDFGEFLDACMYPTHPLETGSYIVGGSIVGFFARATTNAIGRSRIPDEYYSNGSNNVESGSKESHFLVAIDLGSSVLIDLLRIIIEAKVASMNGYFPGWEAFLGLHGVGNIALGTYHRLRGKYRLGLTPQQFEKAKGS